MTLGEMALGEMTISQVERLLGLVNVLTCVAVTKSSLFTDLILFQLKNTSIAVIFGDMLCFIMERMIRFCTTCRLA